MSSKRVTAFGEPENDGERRVIRYLDEQLPPSYRIYHSLERQSGGQTYEWDVIVLAPHAVFCLEVKDWPGRIKGNDREWILQNGAVRRNPYPLIAKKARVLKSQLVQRDAFLRSVWVEPLVVIADDSTELDLRGDCDKYTVTLRDVVARLTDNSNPQWAGRDHTARFADIEGVLTRDSHPAQPSREVAHFRLLEPITATDLYTEWRAENRFGARSVRLKIYAPDPYLPQAQRDDQLRLVSRDFEAASRLGSHPHILTARDFFPDEAGRYILVLDDIPGRSLEAELLSGRSFTFEQKLRLVEDIADGLAHAHACNVIHRDVRPVNIWPSPTGAILINFDCARLGNGNTINAMIKDDLDPRYLAPEIRANLGAATAASDVYALGVVLYELLTGQLPTQNGDYIPLMSFDPLAGPTLDGLACDMLATEPAMRPSAAEVRNKVAELRDQRHSATPTPLAAGTGAGGQPTVDFPVGTQIEGQYLVREVLGEGSFSKVYRVYAAVPDREYAMKVFRDPGLGLEDAQKEFVALSQLQHPRIARVWHAGRLRQGTYYLLTDCVEGRPLQQFIGESRPAPADAIRYALDLLDALAYLHSQGYVHRDIKPSNVVVSASGACLIDFNIAVHTAAGSSERAGTPRYAPPDILGCGSDPTRDLFAVGVMLFEMLTGSHPYDGPPRPGSEPSRPEDLEPRLTNQLATVLRRAVAAKASDRYAAAAEFRDDLRAVDEPMRPAEPSYDLVLGIVVSEAERAQRNHNPYLSRFLTLYSQNRDDNSSTRGYDEISRATYVRTRLDKRLRPDILDGRFHLVIITGNAGDGKTALLQSLEESIGEKTGGQATKVVPLPSGNGAGFTLAGREYRTNYDGSQDEAGMRNDDALADFFAPFAGSPAEIAQRIGSFTRIIAINQGKLREFLEHGRDRFTWLAEAVEGYLEEGKALPEGYVVVNLNERSLVEGDCSILDEQVLKLCNPVFWQPCVECEYASRCPVKFNVDTMNHPDLGPRVRHRLRRLFEIVHLRGRLHLTMRSIRSTLAYILFGTDNCSEIATRLTSVSGSTDQDEALLQRFYYNAVAVLERPEAEDGGEQDKLLRLLCEADVGLGANPADDRDLHFEGTEMCALLPAAGNRPVYDQDLMKAIRERLAAETDLVARREAQRRLHAMLRRKAYFERSDAGWEPMLPFAMLGSMLLCGKRDEKALIGLKAAIISGINHGEGAEGMENVVALRLAQGVPGRVQSYRQFNGDEFDLQVARPLTSSDYIEFSPSYLELVYRPGTNGVGAKRPALRIGLDLLELLVRMGQGYAPTAAEWRGPLVNLRVFRTLLSQEPYDQLVVIDSAHGHRFTIEKHGGQIQLRQEVGSDATG